MTDDFPERKRVTAEELTWSLRSVNRATAGLDHALAAKLGLRQIDYEAVGLIMDQDEDQIGPAELGQRLGISTGSATELVDRLERAGHVSRNRDAIDRRRVRLVARQEAVARILGELGPLFADLDALSGDFTDDEQAVINRYLGAVVARVRFRTDAITASPPNKAAASRPHLP